MTEHAYKRLNQRGFSDDMIKVIKNYGICEHAPGGALRITFNNKQYQQTLSDLKKFIHCFDRAKGGTIIIKDNQILTMYKRGSSYENK
jgi:hypothetical protein